MAIIYTGQTALEFWRWHARTGTPTARPAVSRMQRIPLGTPSVSEALIESTPFRETFPISLLVASSNYDCKQITSTAKNARCVVRSVRFPHGSFCRISNGVYVVSPELLFLEMASLLDFFDLLLLGSELTSTYTPNDTDVRGFSSCDPLTSPQAIERLLNSLSNYVGIRKAKRAVVHLIPNAASPMETEVALLLSLPKRLGGFGLPKPVLNREIYVDKERCGGYRRNVIRFDLLWSSARYALEYDSDQWHSSVERLHADSMRRNAIRAMGFDVASITYNEVQDINKLTTIAQTLARGIGHRMRPISFEEFSKREQLMRKLKQLRLQTGNPT